MTFVSLPAWSQGLAFACVYVAMLWWVVPSSLSPDGRFYLAPWAARPAPYHRRWLVPWVCGASLSRWRAVSLVSLVALGPLMATYANGDWRAALLLLTLPGVCRVNMQLPVLVDAPAYALALGSACCAQAGLNWQAAGLAVLAGACHERAPWFAAAWAWSPWPMLGVFATLLTVAHPGAQPPNGVLWLGPWRQVVATVRHRHNPADAQRMLLPWGALTILAPVGGFSARCWAALVLGYGQLLLAMDGARLYQWAAPPLVAVACTVQGPWVTVLLVLHVFNPWINVF